MCFEHINTYYAEWLPGHCWMFWIVANTLYTPDTSDTTNPDSKMLPRSIYDVLTQSSNDF